MPLSELFRLATAKKKSEIPSRDDNEFAELVFENGEIKMKSKSTRTASATPARIGIHCDISPLEELCDDDANRLRSYGRDYGAEFVEGPSTVSAMQNVFDQPNSRVSDVVVSRGQCGSNLLDFSRFPRPAEKIKVPALSVVNHVVESMPIDQCEKIKSRRLAVQVQAPEGARNEKLCRETSDKKEEIRISMNSEAMPASSVCSGNGAKRVASCEKNRSKRKFCDVEQDSECRSDDIETESTRDTKPSPPRGRSGSKRTRAAEVHSLSERKRRDRINEKMRALQELLPNCSKVDKASMLDEAIEYMKTLQLQVQIMSMGARLCMPPMMFPTGMHPLHYPSMGAGMGIRMAYGIGMPYPSGRNPGCPGFSMAPVNGFPTIVPPLNDCFGLHNSTPVPGQPQVINSATSSRPCTDQVKNEEFRFDTQ